MFFFDYIRYSVLGMLNKKSRIMLTVISILIGIISVTVISNIGSSGQLAVDNELNKLGLNGISIKSKKMDLDTEDAYKVKECLGNNYSVSTFSKNVGEGYYNNKKSDLVVWGGEEDILKILNFNVIYGRGIRKKDVSDHKNIAIITESASKKIFNKVNSIGEKITIKSPVKLVDLIVVGVVDNSGLYEKISANMPSFIYIPSTVYKDIYGDYSIGDISLVGQENEDLNSLGENVIKILSPKKELYFENINNYKKTIGNIADLVTLIITLIGAISLIVGGISVMNTMLVSVNERKKEIGIKKALGETNVSIMAEILTESLIIVVFSCILGMMIGIFISYIIVKLCDIELSISVSSLLSSFVFSVFTGSIFGIYPAYKASKLDPVKSLSN